MAYDKIIVIRTRLDHCIGYVLNHEKTDLHRALEYIGDPDKNTLAGPDGEAVQLETALNCELETASQDMRTTKRRWGKDGMGHVLGYHLIHSYAPGEATPEQAHAASLDFAQRLLGDRYEVVVSTHLDRDHYHSHIVFNSVSFADGVMYRNNFKDYFRGYPGIVQRGIAGAWAVGYQAGGQRSLLC